MTEVEVTQDKESSGTTVLRGTFSMVRIKFSIVKGNDVYRWDPLEQGGVQLKEEILTQDVKHHLFLTTNI